MNEEHYMPRSIIGIIITTWAAGILIGLAANKAIWKKPACDHPEIPAWVAYVPTNDMVQVRSNVRRVIQEMYDTPRSPTKVPPPRDELSQLKEINAEIVRLNAQLNRILFAVMATNSP